MQPLGCCEFASRRVEYYPNDLRSSIFNTISATKYPLSLLQSILNETLASSSVALVASTNFTYFVLVLGPRFRSGTHGIHHPWHYFSPRSSTMTRPRGPSRAQGLMPLNIYFARLSSGSDWRNQNAVRASVRRLQASAINIGRSDIAHAALYPNYPYSIRCWSACRVPTYQACGGHGGCYGPDRQVNPEHGKWCMLFVVNVMRY